MESEEIIRQIDLVIENYNKNFSQIRINTKYTNLNGPKERVLCLEVYPLICETLERFSPYGRNFYSNAAFQIINKCDVNSVDSLVHNIPALIALLTSLKTAYEKNLLTQLRELYHADIFNDFLEMGEYFLNEHYKDAAAMMIGGVLEEHLRKLSQKYNIFVKKEEKDNLTKKAATLNDELKRAGILKNGDHKSVTAWLAIRNSAAHAKYTEFDEAQVKLMLLGVRDFLSRHPA
jgi:hypothetical protein